MSPSGATVRVDWGDGSTSAALTHLYTSYAKRVITVTATNAAGSTEAIKTFQQIPPKPTIQIIRVVRRDLTVNIITNVDSATRPADNWLRQLVKRALNACRPLGT